MYLYLLSRIFLYTRKSHCIFSNTTAFYVISEYFRSPLTHIPDFIYHILVKFRLMTDQKNTSSVFFECTLQSFFCIDIQVVRRLVEKQYIRVSVNQFAQTYLCLLTTTQNADLTLYMLCGQTTFCQRRTNFILCIGRKFLPQFFDTGCLVITFYFLLKVTQLQIFSTFTVPFE